MLNIYKYCFYRIAQFWKCRGFENFQCYLSSLGYVSLLQFANVITLLIVPAVLLHIHFPSVLIIGIVLLICIINFFIIKGEQLYVKCEARWKVESKVAKTRNKWIIIIFSIISMALMFISLSIYKF